jgi:uncharacterized protein
MQNSKETAVIAATRHWLEEVVIGLTLCPFARQPWEQGRVMIKVSQADNVPALAEALIEALLELDNTPAEDCETVLLVHPAVLDDFDDYNAFLATADALLATLGLTGVFQIASFHPDYRFAGTDADDPANCTNRSPWPMLHLIRQDSVEAVMAERSPDSIVERNIATLRQLGERGWRALMPNNKP